MNFERTNTKISLLEDFYTHFDEDTRLKTRHGFVEYYTNMHYINEVLKEFDNPSILDLGAGTGAYSVPLSDSGYNVTAVELVKHNAERIKEKSSKVKVYNASAIDLSFLEDSKYDVILIFGPIYHVHTETGKLQIILEAKKHLKDNGKILISYYMNDYAVMMYGFIKGNIKESIENKQLDENFKVITNDQDLFSFNTIDDINKYNSLLNLKRYKLISSDGLSDYIRTNLNKLDNDDFNKYLEYHLSVCERYEMLGYASHLLDIVEKL